MFKAFTSDRAAVAAEVAVLEVLVIAAASVDRPAEVEAEAEAETGAYKPFFLPATVKEPSASFADDCNNEDNDDDDNEDDDSESKEAVLSAVARRRCPENTEGTSRVPFPCRTNGTANRNTNGTADGTANGTANGTAEGSVDKEGLVGRVFRERGPAILLFLR